MSEAEERRCIIDLVLWADENQVSTIWSFVSHYMKGEIIGVHAEPDFIIAHADYLKAKRRKAKTASTTLPAN